MLYNRLTKTQTVDYTLTGFTGVGVYTMATKHYSTLAAKSLKMVFISLFISYGIIAIHAIIANYNPTLFGYMSDRMYIFNIYIGVSFLSSPYLFFILNKKTLEITFSAEGIICIGFFKTKKLISWEQFREIGIGMYANEPENQYFYFSQVEFTDNLKAQIESRRAVADIIAVKQTEEIRQEVTRYYHGGFVYRY